ncbi:MAG: GerW family sporulation protein [Bacteroidales bacterium]|nr:GerW family sporulation protein [Bacteroidales bacterium]
MENNVDQLLDKISEHVKSMTKTETVLGEEFQIGNYTCKPVIRIGVGFGSGGGSGDDPKRKCNGTGGGAVAGIGISPVGFLVAKGDEISFIPSDKSKGLNALIDKVPDIMEKVADMKHGKEEKKESKKESK